MLGMWIYKCIETNKGIGAKLWQILATKPLRQMAKR